jgi:monoamine oxidase
VILLEARDRLGGRVFTERRRGWPTPIELGAQFIHGGNGPLWDLLKRHRIETQPVPERHWVARDGIIGEFDAEKRIAAITEAIDEKTMRGWSFAKFMRRHGQSFDPIDRDLAMGFVEGFEAAPTDQMSAIAVAGETLEDGEQYFLPGGYDQVVDALTRELEGVRIFLAVRARRIRWREGAVEVRTGNARFTATHAIVTLPLGVLQAAKGERGYVEFEPTLAHHANTAARMGVGQVIRLTLRFEARAYKRMLPEPLRSADAGFGFIHSRADGVPVWWSLTDGSVLTGWAGGPNAIELSRKTARAIVTSALNSLATVLGRSREEVRAAVVDFATHNWTRDPASRGAYSFTRAGQDDASAKLRRPIADTIFFAGEATADGAEVGTVHGALASGLRAADEVAEVLTQR